MTRPVPYKTGDQITVTHDTYAGKRCTDQVTVRTVVPLTDGVTFRVETTRSGGGSMHLYVDSRGVVAVGELASP